MRALSHAMGSKSLGRILAYAALSNGVRDRSVVTREMINGYLTPLLEGTDMTYYQFITSFDTMYEALETYREKFTNETYEVTIIW